MHFFSFYFAFVVSHPASPCSCLRFPKRVTNNPQLIRRSAKPRRHPLAQKGCTQNHSGAPKGSRACLNGPQRCGISSLGHSSGHFGHLSSGYSRGHFDSVSLLAWVGIVVNRLAATIRWLIRAARLLPAWTPWKKY
ncbi:hypothetical protein ElyMa_003689000 [Elysia marginata]|uniref:Secreted protein n=1 Tax=Elysia marginata TaxID=1093978 RepID=A0AAV4F1M6_9GAST|nr:hypothetical protein ElyMa_003689000 [Elysia marginata]